MQTLTTLLGSAKRAGLHKNPTVLIFGGIPIILLGVYAILDPIGFLFSIAASLAFGVALAVFSLGLLLITALSVPVEDAFRAVFRQFKERSRN